MTVLNSTLADLTAAKLVAYARDNMPAVPPVIAKPSTDRTVVESDNYIKNINLTQFEGIVYGGGIDGRLTGMNPYALDRFANLCHEWEQHGKSQDAIPAWPQMFAVDPAAFDQWWTMVVATDTEGSPTRGENAPPLFFMKPAPPLPRLVILDAAAPPAPPPATDGPIGAAVPYNPGVFNSAGPTDNFRDGYIYAGPTGVYQKHIYSNPFTAGQVRIIWIALQLTPALPSPSAGA